jgi:threonine/homoserine/homoserine lactone efflux protein
MTETLPIVFIVTSILIKGPIGYGAGILSSWLHSRPAVIAWINRGSGMILVGLALRLAFEQKN